MKKTTQLQGITDLTVLAPVKTGFVPGVFNPTIYADRLTRVLQVLNRVRQASREASLQRSPFADSIGRFRGIHFFRFAVVPGVEGPGTRQLLLNVTFDGGWEPYMRIVWGPLGKLLDLMFCNCEGYPMAFQCSFDEYMRWVRAQEVPSSFFYADSAATVADSHYLRQLEELQCVDGGRADADLRAAGVALVDPPPRTIPSLYAVMTSVRVLKALASLRDLFPKKFPNQTEPDFEQDLVLLRFARDLLSDLREWIELGLFDPGGPFDGLSDSFMHERNWLMSLVDNPSKGKDRLVFDRAHVQAGIVKSYPPEVRHGVLVLLRIKDKSVKAAKAWLSEKHVTPDDGKAPADGIYRSLALTYPGLKRLELPDDHLDRLPHAFIEGMEARAGVLGDLRSNHPDHWRRPLKNWPAEGRPPVGPPIELSTVHVLVQLRTALTEDEERVAADGVTLVERLETQVKKLETGTGLQVLFVQPMKLGAIRPGEKAGRDHFGYVDGLSQPILSGPVPPSSYWSDQVKAGDVFLGYSNSRGDTPEHAPPAVPILENGTFLVVRKLSQFPDRLEAALAEAADRLMPDAGPGAKGMLRDDIKAKIMGRRTDGTPLVKSPGMNNNDFDFRSDGNGLQCPHRSHIRRANPRGPLPLPPPPRIVRRGMSFGPPAGPEPDNKPRGIVFMAYNASIAEQFEVIQRWLTGGNSSGLSSSQDDPLLGVPEIGQRRTYRYVNEGKVMRVDLGEKPLVAVEWGLYAFVPSLAALETFAEVSKEEEGKERGRAKGEEKGKETVLPSDPEDLPDSESKKRWRLQLEDENVRANTWKEVREKHGGVRDGEDYGLLVGSKDRALEVLKDDGGKFSVEGYGRRMDKSIGHGFLGMDDVPPHKGHKEQAPDVNKIIEKVSEEQAFTAAFRHAREHLKMLLAVGQAATGKPQAPVDVIEFARKVLALLCTDWFGLPDKDGVLMKHGTKADDVVPDGVPRCPGHFLTVSRYIFSPHPMTPVNVPARAHGDLILEKAVKKLLAEAKAGKRELTELVKSIVNASGIAGDAEREAKTVAGVMLGFPPTVLGNLCNVLIGWIENLQLWELQLEMPAEVDYAGANDVLRDAFLTTMGKKPVPYVIWRTAMTDQPLGKSGIKKGCPVVVGLGSAVENAKDENDWMLMFGGKRHETTHACPGYAMAMGVMLGSVAALLAAGVLTRTGDPRVLILTGGH